MLGRGPLLPCPARLAVPGVAGCSLAWHQRLLLRAVHVAPQSAISSNEKSGRLPVPRPAAAAAAEAAAAAAGTHADG